MPQSPLSTAFSGAEGQSAKSAEWLEATEADLLPVPCFHVVFTLPSEIAEIAQQNKKVMYGILMRAASQTLLQIAADPKQLGAKIGILSVLHTWGQTLTHHPHVHCIVTVGGLSIESGGDPQRWISSRPNYFLSVHVLSQLFRGKFLAMTKRAFADGKLSFQGKLEELSKREAFDRRLQPCFA